MWILIRLSTLLMALQRLCKQERLLRGSVLTSWHFTTGTAQIQEREEGASGRGSTVCCRTGSRPRSSLPGTSSLPVPNILSYEERLSPLSPTCDPRLSVASLLQRSEVLEHIWKQDDIWPTPLCQGFILQWTTVLESKVHLRGQCIVKKKQNKT